MGEKTHGHILAVLVAAPGAAKFLPPGGTPDGSGPLRDACSPSSASHRRRDACSPVQSRSRMGKPFYITTAIHYVNDDPHIGHMYENIVADVIARHRRRMGDDVRFLTGTDEHGQKIERAAAKEGISPMELADRVVKTHHGLWEKLGISHDDFIRTTEQRHRIAVLEVIRRIQERNPTDIYLGEHSGWYCQSEETYIPENQVTGGNTSARDDA